MKQVINGKTYYVDSNGALMPEETIKPMDLLRDQTIESIVSKVDVLKAEMTKKKAEIMDEINTLVNIAAEEYKVKMGGEKGNLQIISYDGLTKIVISNQQKQGFNEGVVVAEKIINELLREWTTDSSKEIKALVSRAFKLKQGQINVKGILNLRTLNIDDPKWLEAMNIISDSLITLGTKQYFRVYKKENPNSDFINIPLDLSVL